MEEYSYDKFVFYKYRNNVTKNTTQIFSTKGTDAETRKPVSKDTLNSAKHMRERDSAPMKKTVHTTTKYETKTKVKETYSTVIT